MAVVWLVILGIHLSECDANLFDYFVAGFCLLVCALGIRNQMRRPA